MDLSLLFTGFYLLDPMGSKQEQLRRQALNEHGPCLNRRTYINLPNQALTLWNDQGL